MQYSVQAVLLLAFMGYACYVAYTGKARDRLLMMILVLLLACVATWQAYNIGLYVGERRTKALVGHEESRATSSPSDDTPLHDAGTNRSPKSEKVQGL